MLQYSNFKIFIVLVFILIGINSCTEKKNTHVDIYGISFDCPAGWKVKETQDYGAVKYVCINGATSNALLTMSFSDSDFELEEYLEIFKESFMENGFKNMVFKQTVEGDYGKYKGIVSSYTFNVIDIEHEGQIYVFKENGIIMCLLKQEATEDHKKNLSGFEIIMNSLTL